MLQIGNRVMRMPSIHVEKDGSKSGGPIRGTVVYIHPRGRFHVVRFVFPFGSFCETFWGVAP